MAKQSNKMIMFIVNDINRTLSVDDAANATGVKYLYGSTHYALYLPSGEGNVEKITFIPIKKTMSPDAVDALVAETGGEYASFHGLCKHNRDNPDFAKDVPHFTQGKYVEGRHCFAAFNEWDGERGVYVDSDEFDWGDYWYVAVALTSPEGLVA